MYAGRPDRAVILSIAHSGGKVKAGRARTPGRPDGRARCLSPCGVGAVAGPARAGRCRCVGSVRRRGRGGAIIKDAGAVSGGAPSGRGCLPRAPVPAVARAPVRVPVRLPYGQASRAGPGRRLSCVRQGSRDRGRPLPPSRSRHRRRWRPASCVAAAPGAGRATGSSGRPDRRPRPGPRGPNGRHAGPRPVWRVRCHGRSSRGPAGCARRRAPDRGSDR